MNTIRYIYRVVAIKDKRSDKWFGLDLNSVPLAMSYVYVFLRELGAVREEGQYKYTIKSLQFSLSSSKWGIWDNVVGVETKYEG